MPVQLLHIYGPLGINAYGTMIALGVLLALTFLFKDKKCKQLIDEQKLSNGISFSILLGVLGGRLLWFFEKPYTTRPWTSFISLWNGGFSILGTILILALFIPLYLRLYKIPVLPVLDRIALYAPLVDAFGRIGCFFAGCCYGINTTLPWGVVYSNSSSFAPLFTKIHPTQLYSALLFFLLFTMLWKQKDQKYSPGFFSAFYLIGASFIRFVIDFLRGDRKLLISVLSFAQCIALCIMFVGLFLLVKINHAKSTSKSF